MVSVSALLGRVRSRVKCGGSHWEKGQSWAVKEKNQSEHQNNRVV